MRRKILVPYVILALGICVFGVMSLAALYAGQLSLTPGIIRATIVWLFVALAIFIFCLILQKFVSHYSYKVTKKAAPEDTYIGKFTFLYLYAYGILLAGLLGLMLFLIDKRIDSTPLLGTGIVFIVLSLIFNYSKFLTIKNTIKNQLIPQAKGISIKDFLIPTTLFVLTFLVTLYTLNVIHQAVVPH